jgi:RecJ-like exonuclease
VSGDCVVCGGDGRMQNSFGNTGRCPACHGTGRRADEGGMRDVTKTKPSHHKAAQPHTPGAGQATAVKVAASTEPTTGEGQLLARDVDASALSPENKLRLRREIVEFEEVRGACTQTFLRKIRKQLRG